MSRLFVTGDTHGELDVGKVSEINFPEQRGLTKEDFLLIAGDFGAVWKCDMLDGKLYIPGTYKPSNKFKYLGSDRYLLNSWEDQNYTVLFVDGNHENHKLLNAYPISEWHGGKVHYIRPGIIHLMRGQCYRIGGKTIFCMGGATSVDREYRETDYSWFEEELPSEEEYTEARKNLDDVGWKVDYVITHCCSNHQLYKLAPSYYIINGFQRDALTDFFDELEDKLMFEKWYFGHHHMDIDTDDKHTCLYNTIQEVDIGD